MIIIDLREAAKKYKVREALERALPLLPQDVTPGIRNIVLLDADSHGDKRDAARYVNVEGTDRSDIEMCFSHYSEIPEEIAGNHVFTGMLAVKSLFHELHRHMVRFNKKKRKPEFDLEQRQAGTWAEEAVMQIMLDIYPFEENRDEYDQIRAMGKKVGYLLEV